MYEALMKVVQGQTVNLELGYVGFIAIGYTFCIDFFRVGTLRKARESESSTMRAGFYHAIADLSSTVIALLGFGLATLGFGYGDALASMVLSFLLSYLSVRLVWSSGMELSDTVSRDVANKVRKEIIGTKGICALKDLKIRKAGDKTFVRATVQVPDYLGLEDAHDLTSGIETNLLKLLGNAEVAIHTEPCETEMPTERLVEKLATEVKGVREAHEINTTYTEGKLYITLHAYVDPKLSIEEAHRKAEEIENKIDGRIGNIENITVHIEPMDAKKKKGSTADEDEIRKIVHETTKLWRKTSRIKRIVTYVADRKRYINMDCSFTSQTSIEEAHRIASEIEEKIKARFAETIVTIHTESEQT
jgi:divalent metal cation (Fe/Co/Zn/Cd) transporter